MKALSLNEFMKINMEDFIETYLKFLRLPFLHLNVGDYYRTYADFLNQPFKPELIVEKFKGWEQISNIYFEDTNNLHSISMYYRNQFNIYSNTLKYAINFPIPKTLEDFIKFCSYAEIELEFKEQ